MIFLSPVFLVLVFPLLEHFRGHALLIRYKRHLLAKGFKLSAQDFKHSRPQDENGAPEFFRAAQELQPGFVLPKAPPPRMQITPSGRAVVGFREEEWIEDKETNHWTQLLVDLETNQPALQRIRAALEMPVFDNQLDVSLGPNTKFAHLLPPKTLAQWFGAETQLALREGYNKKALENLVAESRLTRVLAEDHILISELVRIAIAAIARTGVWEALQADGWKDADLAKLAEAWQSITFAPNMTHSLEGELVFGITEYDSMRTSNSNAVQAIYGLQNIFEDETERGRWEKILRELPGGEKSANFIKEQVYCRLWRFAWLDQDELHYLKFMEALFDISHRAESDKSLAATWSLLEQLLESSTRKSLYNNLRYPQDYSFGTIANCLKRSMKAETERSLILTAIALKRYALRFGKPPSTLALLIPEFLASVPTDYMDGRPIRYRSNDNGTFTPYSAGEDGKDDDGDSSLQSGRTSTQNLWNRKDFVWPAPATPDEVKAYRREKISGR